MDERTLAALHASIKKWEGIVAGTTVDYGSDNSPLCKLFDNDHLLASNHCNGCPVYGKSGRKFCFNTPHDDWVLASRHEADRRTADTPEAVKAAEAMRDYLISLLPDGEQEQI